MRTLAALSLVCLLCAAAACHAVKAPAPGPREAAPASAKASPAADDVPKTVTAALDRTADPCADFYQFACGGWLAKTEIPADQTYWGRGFSEIEKRNEELLRAILEKAERDPGPDKELARLGDYYAACMDEREVEKAGAGPLRPMLDRIAAVSDTGGLARVVGELHRISAGALFRTEVDADFKDPDLSVLFLNQGGLGLFDRDYYLLDDEQHAPLRQAYEQHVEKMLVLLGEPEADAKRHAGQILAFETGLARLSRARADLRDPDKNYNRLDLAGLRKLSPGFEWDTYLASSGYPGLTQIVVGQPEFFEGLSTQAAKADAETLRAYLRWHLLHSQAAFLSKAFVEEDFQFYGATLSGQKEDRPRWKKCVEATDGAMGESLGRYFVERAFPGDSKTIGLDLIGRIEAAFRANLDKLAWMDPATRKRAQEKLQALTNKIGYPDAWRDYSALKVVRNDYYANATAAETFEFKRVMDKVGKPVDRKEWGMSPPAVNAYYNPLNNEMVFPAGIMQPPFFKNDYPAAMNFGGIGLVMGHELTHGYDDQGRKFDPKGRLAEWWDPSAGEKFEKQAACVEDLYSSFEPQPGVHVNGKLTLGENIADFGGIKAAYQAWKSWEADKRTPAGAVEGLTNDQLFFVGFAQAWCAKMTPEMQRLLINLDPHSPDKYRVNGPLSNFSVFGEAFSCKVGDPMRPQKVCTVW